MTSIARAAGGETLTTFPPIPIGEIAVTRTLVSFSAARARNFTKMISPGAAAPLAFVRVIVAKRWPLTRSTLFEKLVFPFPGLDLYERGYQRGIDTVPFCHVIDMWCECRETPRNNQVSLWFLCGEVRSREYSA